MPLKRFVRRKASQNRVFIEDCPSPLYWPEFSRGCGSYFTEAIEELGIPMEGKERKPKTGWRPLRSHARRIEVAKAL